MLASGWLMICNASNASAAACSWPMPPSIRIRLGKGLEVRPAQVCNATEGPQQLASRRGSNARYVVQSRPGLPLGATQAVEGDRETVGLVADLLNEVQYRRVMFEDDGFIFLAKDVKDLFFFGDAR